MMHDWQIDFGPAFGAAGTSKVLTQTPQVNFRGEKVMATDSSPNPGRGARVSQLLVGNKPQRPLANGSTLAQFFGPEALGNSVRWDECPKGLTIAITIEFTSSCTVDISVFGKAS